MQQNAAYNLLNERFIYAWICGIVHLMLFLGWNNITTSPTFRAGLIILVVFRVWTVAQAKQEDHILYATPKYLALLSRLPCSLS